MGGLDWSPDDDHTDVVSAQRDISERRHRGTDNDCRDTLVDAAAGDADHPQAVTGQEETE